MDELEPRTARLCASCRVSGACLLVPDIKSHSPERTICVTCQQMAAWVEVATDECVSGQEVLGLLGRFEPLHLPFPTPRRSM